ncbi:unnamed protein product [Lota lota]
MQEKRGRADPADLAEGPIARSEEERRKPLFDLVGFESTSRPKKNHTTLEWGSGTTAGHILASAHVAPVGPGFLFRDARSCGLTAVFWGAAASVPDMLTTPSIDRFWGGSELSGHGIGRAPSAAQLLIDTRDAARRSLKATQGGENTLASGTFPPGFCWPGPVIGRRLFAPNICGAARCVEPGPARSLLARGPGAVAIALRAASVFTVSIAELSHMLS